MKGKRIYLYIFLVLSFGVLGITNIAYADEASIEWIRQFGTTNWDESQDIVVDYNNNIYVTGVLPSYQANLTKFNGDGNLIFTQFAGNYGRGLAVDKMNNVYMTGESFEGGYGNGMIVKFNPDGTQAWYKYFQGFYGNKITVDSEQNIYILGIGGGNNLASTYISKFSPTGDLIWKDSFPTPYGFAKGIIIDPFGDIWITGSIGYDYAIPGQSSSGGYDVYIGKYSSDGERLLLKQFGGNYHDWGNGLAIDSEGNIYVAGYTQNVLTGNWEDWDKNAFVAKYALNGDQLWIKQVAERCSAIAIDNDNNFYFAGSTPANVAVAKYNNNLSEKYWGIGFGSIEGNWTTLTGIALDSSLNVYVTGISTGTLPGQQLLSNPDAFVAKIKQPTTLNRAPVISPIGDKTVDIGQSLDFTIGATDPDGDILTYSASNLPQGAIFNSVSGAFQWTPDFNQAGTYPTVRFTVSDGKQSVSQDITITVNNVNRAPVLDPIGIKTVDEGQLIQFILNASDPDGDILTYSAFGLPTGATLDPATGLFNWRPVYNQTGSYTVNFSVSDGALNDNENVIITVNNINRSPSLGVILNMAVDEGQQLTFTISATDPDGDALTYSAIRLPEGATLDPATGLFSWRPNYNQTGSYTVNFGVSDGALSDSQDINIIVNNVNVPPVITSDASEIIVDEGGQATNTGNWSDQDLNDTVTLTSIVGSVTQLGTNEKGTWNWTYNAVDDTNQTVNIEADDGTVSSITSFNLKVNNVAPSVGIILGPTDPVQVGTAISVSADFTDPGINDTLTAEWDFGDGVAAGTVNEVGGSGSVSGTNTYTEPGVYTIRLIVTDDDGGYGASIYDQFVVVYDPSAGFVTGGGWINSPDGAYIADPTLTGRADFGFVSRYQKGATVPTGQTQFKFKVADMSFHSSSYDWLVIAGAKAQYKGSGTVNGSGDYGFMLSAIDGDINGDGIDKFRIKIWDKSTGNKIYDNQVGETDDNADPSTAIEGGSITIHK